MILPNSEKHDSNENINMDALSAEAIVLNSYGILLI